MNEAAASAALRCPTCRRPMPMNLRDLGGRTLAECVRDYVRRHPGATAAEVRVGLRLAAGTSLRVRAALYSMVRDGRMRSEFAPRASRFWLEEVE